MLFRLVYLVMIRPAFKFNLIYWLLVSCRLTFTWNPEPNLMLIFVVRIRMVFWLYVPDVKLIRFVFERTMWKSDVTAQQQRGMVLKASEMLKHIADTPDMRMNCVAIPPFVSTYNMEASLHILHQVAAVCSLRCMSFHGFVFFLFFNFLCSEFHSLCCLVLGDYTS